jgi:branched-subunit amino acid transport protein AzlD
MVVLRPTVWAVCHCRCLKTVAVKKLQHTVGSGLAVHVVQLLHTHTLKVDC